MTVNHLLFTAFAFRDSFMSYRMAEIYICNRPVSILDLVLYVRILKCMLHLQTMRHLRENSHPLMRIAKIKCSRIEKWVTVF